MARRLEQRLYTQKSRPVRSITRSAALDDLDAGFLCLGGESAVSRGWDS